MFKNKLYQILYIHIQESSASSNGKRPIVRHINMQGSAVEVHEAQQ